MEIFKPIQESVQEDKFTKMIAIHVDATHKMVKLAVLTPFVHKPKAQVKLLTQMFWFFQAELFVKFFKFFSSSICSNLP